MLHHVGLLEYSFLNVKFLHEPKNSLMLHIRKIHYLHSLLKGKHVIHKPIHTFGRTFNEFTPLGMCELHPLVGKKWFKQWRIVATLSL